MYVGLVVCVGKIIIREVNESFPKDTQHEI